MAKRGRIKEQTKEVQETVEDTTATSRATLVLGSLIHPNLTHAALFLEIVDMHCFIPKSVSGATSLPASPTMTGVCNNKKA